MACVEECFTTFRSIVSRAVSVPGLHIQLIKHAPVLTSQEAAEQRGVDMRSGAKAMLIFDKKSSKYALTVLPAHLSCDFQKIATVIGSTKNKLRMATEKEVKEITGCLPGAVPPFACCFPQPVTLFLDEKIKENTAAPADALSNTRIRFVTASDEELPAGVDITALQPIERGRTDCLNFNVGLRTISCSIPLADYFSFIEGSDYQLCDISN